MISEILSVVLSLQTICARLLMGCAVSTLSHFYVALVPLFMQYYWLINLRFAR